jgi:hypothetical protein
VVEENDGYVCLVTALTMALAMAGQSSGQSFNTATVAHRTTTIKSLVQRLGSQQETLLDTRSSQSERTTYETNPAGGPLCVD